MKETVVLFPTLGMGHLIPMVQLAKHFIRHDFAVTILVLDSPFATTSTTSSPFISTVSSAHPSISFHRLPTITPPPPRQPNSNPLLLLLDLLRLANPHILHFLKSLSQTSHISALVLDVFCTATLDVARELSLPSYVFYAASAFSIDAFLFFPTLQSQTTASFKDLGDAPLHFPGLPPIPASHMPVHLLDRHDEIYDAFMSNMERLPMADGIMINTFESLEGRAIEALRSGLCLPGRSMPPIYCIGPLIAEGSEERHECLTWLDAQPNGSVVFLCFGSMGAFPAEQLREMANGLERSGQRFLWVVRSPVSDHSKRFEKRPEPDLEILLPEGFLERTEERGLVVKSWAPQAAVLKHETVGGFVTHCGWNSVLEAICSGVPMIAWPLYAEQKMNKVFLVEEAELAVAMEGYDKELVSAEEVEGKIRWVMESEGGKELRDRAAAVKASAMAAGKEGGSSHAAWLELVRATKKTTDCVRRLV